MADWSFRTLGMIALASAAAAGGSVAAQSTATSPDVLSALLIEVRGLRAAIEQMASAGPRIELALGRLQLQEQRVNNVLRRHTDVRERLMSAERDADNLARQMESLQLALQTVIPDEKERKAMQQILAEQKDRHAQMNADLLRLRAEETEVAQMVASEQARWTEINQRLEDLERTLTSRK